MLNIGGIMKNKIFNVKISDKLREKLRVEAFNNKTTMSGIVRKILMDYFKNNTNE
jgi:hypothetical protein